MGALCRHVKLQELMQMDRPYITSHMTRGIWFRFNDTIYPFSRNPRLKIWYNLMKWGLTCKSVKIKKISSDDEDIEPPHGKTNNLHRRKQRRRSASR